MGKHEWQRRHERTLTAVQQGEAAAAGAAVPQQELGDMCHGMLLVTASGAAAVHERAGAVRPMGSHPPTCAVLHTTSPVCPPCLPQR